VEPLIPHPTLAQRIDLLAVVKPEVVRRNLWISFTLGLWSTVGLLASLVATNWGLAALLFAVASFNLVSWYVFRKALRKAPATQRWIDELQDARGGLEGRG
jgi:hypothetical protein